jgi:hypothetical protein
VATADAQGIGGHQALDVQLLDVVLARRRVSSASRARTSQAMPLTMLDAVSHRALRHVAAKGHHGALHRPLELRAHRRGRMAITSGSSRFSTISPCWPKTLALAAA